MRGTIASSAILLHLSFTVGCMTPVITDPPRTCVSNLHCEDTEYCDSGECRPRCARRADCGETLFCHPDGVCRADDPDAPKTFCGNGERELGEECDQGSLNGGASGCTEFCTVAFCGDGLVQPGVERCDDGNPSPEARDLCTPECEFNSCGDGYVGLGEACDDGNDANDDACNNYCVVSGCGDSIVQPSLDEQCDDGNQDLADDCNTECAFAYCGDGFLRVAGSCTGDGSCEQCDHGPDNGDDRRCTSSCRRARCGDGLLLAETDNAEQCDIGSLCHDGTLRDCTESPSLCPETCHPPVDQGCDPNGCEVKPGWCCIDGRTCVPLGTVNPQNPCEWCKPQTSNTAWSPNDGVPCNDGLKCTLDDACENRVCKGTPNPCTDGQVCTSDRCAETVAGDGCYHVDLDGRACDDRLLCNGADLCLAGECTDHPIGNPCTQPRFHHCAEPLSCPGIPPPKPAYCTTFTCHECFTNQDCPLFEPRCVLNTTLFRYECVP